MLTYHERAHILAEVASHVGLLTVENATNARAHIEAVYVENLDTQLGNKATDAIPYGYLFGDTLSGTILEALVKRGVVSEDELKI